MNQNTFEYSGDDEGAQSWRMSVLLTIFADRDVTVVVTDHQLATNICVIDDAKPLRWGWFSNCRVVLIPRTDVAALLAELCQKFVFQCNQVLLVGGDITDERTTIAFMQYLQSGSESCFTSDFAKCFNDGTSISWHTPDLQYFDAVCSKLSRQ